MTLIAFLKSKGNRWILFLLLIFVTLIFMVHLDLHDTLDPIRYNNESNFITKGENASTSNYLSDAGVGALAGVLAIVISVTMMALQFSSQTYSPLIMKEYINSFLFWSLIGVYTITILFNVFLLNWITYPIDLKLVDTSILLTMLCFILLIPYFYFSVDQLSPEHIFKKRLMLIDKKFIRTSKDKKLPLPQDSDPLSPVIEFIEESMKSNDRAVIMIGIREMHRYYKRVITQENDKFISNYFRSHFLKIAKSAIQNSDTDTIERIVDIYLEMVQKRQEEYPCLVELCSELAGQKELQVDEEIMKLLNKIGKIQYVVGIHTIGLKAARNNKSGVVIEAVQILVDIAKEKSLAEAEGIMNSSLSIIVEATKHELNVTSACRRLDNYLTKVGCLCSIDVELEDELTKNIIPEELHRMFKTKDFSFSENVTVTKEKENEWTIIDEEKFIVKKENEKLNVYKASILESERELKRVYGPIPQKPT